MASQIPEKKKWTQRVKDEWAKIRSFGWKDGITYVWDYYKWYFIVIVVIVLTVLAVNSGRDLRELVLHCSFTAEAYWDDPTYLDDFPSWAGLDEDKYYTYFDPVTRYGTYAQFQISNWINTEQLDVIICDGDMNGRVMRLACFYDLTKILPEDLVEALDGKFYYYEDEALGVRGYYSVDLAEYFGYGEDSSYANGLYFMIPENTKNRDVCISFLRFLVECPRTEHVPAED